MKIQEIQRTAVIAWSPDVIPLLASGSAAGAVDLDFSSSATIEIWDVFGTLPATPIISASVENKLHALAWLNPFEGHQRGILVGAFQNGAVHFWDVDTLIRTMSLMEANIHTSTKHLGAVKCLLFSPHQPHIMASGGQHSEMFIWDLKTFADPTSPGRPTTPMDEISCISWNNAVTHILASTSNAGYTSIWDLKAKREVLHLAYNGPSGRADFSTVAWHPTQSTKLITASQSDACPLIMSWDLRNASEPEKILQGHTKGVLSLDWCLQDANLLISSGKDNSTRLWNPITGVKLGDYPSASNWSFLARFAPRAPDVIATASFDGKVVVQTLQETSPPVSEQVSSKNDDEFWSTIATSDTNQAVFEVHQAPVWLKRPCSASFGFGSKVIVVKNHENKGTVKISKLDTGKKDHEFAKGLTTAIKTNDFRNILASKLEKPSFDSPDWEVLLELERLGKKHFLQALIGDAHLVEDKPPSESLNEKPIPEIDNNEESFFRNLSKDLQANSMGSTNPPYVPSGKFAIIDALQSPVETRLAKLLLSNKIGEAVSVCLESGKLLEALVLSMNQDEDIKLKVKSQFFEQTKSGVISRLIYAASFKDVVDIVSNADISNWKEIAASISAYCKEEQEFNSKLVELGDRIMAGGSGNTDERHNALLCYLAGNALDKVSAIWLADLPDLEHKILTSQSSEISTPHEARYLALASFVEKVSTYRSLSKLSGVLSGPSIEPVCKAVFEFSTIAASNGDFELATFFLSLLPDDFAGLKTEKERIAKATESSSETSHRFVANGGSKSHGRFSSARSASSVTSQMAQAQANNNFARAASVNPLHANVPIAPQQQQRNVAAMLAPTYKAPSNPYAPAGNDRHGSFGGKSVPPRDNSLGITSKPMTSIPPTGPIRPPSTVHLNQVQNWTTIYGNESQAVAPPLTKSSSSSNQKPETEGWNDLPETFKASKPPVRRATASSATIAPAPSFNVGQSPQSQPPKRTQAAHVIPPPPKAGSRSVSKTSAPGTPRMTSSPKPSKYAPPVQASHASQQNAFNGILSPAPAPLPTAPPKNPYAPAVVAQPKALFAIPPGTNFVSPSAPTPATQVVNPYSPGSRNGLRSTSSGLVIGASPQMNLPQKSRLASHSARQTPLQQPVPQFAPPPRAASGRYSSPQLAQSNGFEKVLPPPVSGSNHIPPPPVSNTSQIPPQSVATSKETEPHEPATVSITTPETVQTPAMASLAQAAQSEQCSSAPGLSADLIKNSLGSLLSQVKPVAPPKYAKHVADMEKRLGILFGILSKESAMSDDAINLLCDAANSIIAKDYTRAGAINQQIGQEYPADAGNWHTGVKRLIAMAEVFGI